MTGAILALASGCERGKPSSQPVDVHVNNDTEFTADSQSVAKDSEGSAEGSQGSLPDNGISVVPVQKDNAIAVGQEINLLEKLKLLDKREDELAGYIEMRQMIGSWLTLNAGLRVDHHSKAGTELVPQAGVAFHLPANAEVKLSVGKGFRYPIIREMFMYPPQNDALKAESLWNYEIAFSQTLLSGKLYYGVNLFYLDAKNIIVTAPNPMAPPPMLNQNSDELKNKGVELEASYLISKSFAVNGNYSFLKMENPVIGAPEHKVYLGGSYTQGSLHASTGLQYINGLYSVVNANDPTKNKKENFMLWNARVAYQISDMIRVWVNGDNLLNTKYQINDGYPMPGIAFMGGFTLTL